MLAKAAGDGDGGDGAGGGDAEKARPRMLAMAMVVTALALAVPLQPRFSPNGRPAGLRPRTSRPAHGALGGGGGAPLTELLPLGDRWPWPGRLLMLAEDAGDGG